MWLIGCFRVTTASLVAGLIVATGPAPQALAQPQVMTTEKFGKPMSEAVALVKDRKFSEALKKVDAAASLAGTQKERLAVEQMRTAIYSGLGRTEALIRSLESQLAIGGLAGATVKAHRLTLAGLYGRQGQEAKAVALTKAYIEDYGGSPDQYAFVASNALRARDFASARTYASRAIATTRQSGARKPKETWHRILMRAEFESGRMEGYYAAVEAAARDYPKGEYIRILAERAAKEPAFNNTLNRLDIYRAMSAAGVELSLAERADMAERAYTRGLAAEAAGLLQELAKSGYAGIEKEQAARLQRMLAAAEADARGGLGKLESMAARDSSDRAKLVLAEGYIVAGEARRAAEVIEQALARGRLSEGESGYAQLYLGIAQLRAGAHEAARKTWSAIESDNGSAALARVWILLARGNIV